MAAKLDGPRLAAPRAATQSAIIASRTSRGFSVRAIKAGKNWRYPDPHHPVIHFWKNSLAGRALRFTAAAVGLVVVISTAVSYWVVFRNAEQQRLGALLEYASERAKREDAYFKLAEQDHQVLKAAFLERWHAPDPENLEQRFDTHFTRTADGALRSRRDLVDPSRQASTWVRVGAPITPELKRLVMISHELTEHYFPAWSRQFPTLYISSPLQFNSGIAPDLPEWVWQIAPDFDQDHHEWGLLGSREHNPMRVSRWSRVLPDASIPEWKPETLFTTLCTPVDVDGRHLITLHLDITVSGLLTSAIATERPGLTHLIFRPDGMPIAGAGLLEKIAASNGQFSLQSSGDPILQSIYSAASSQSTLPYAGYDAKSDRYLAVARLETPRWLFVSIIPRADLRAQAVSSAQWVLWSGLAVLVLALSLIGMSFSGQVARPLSQLLEMTQRMKAGEVHLKVKDPGDDELGQLARSFNEMVRSVADRDEALRNEKASLERRVQERTAELRESEARLRMILDHTPIAICTMDADTGRFVDANEHALRLFGLDRENFFSASPGRLSPPTQPDGRSSTATAMAKIQEALAGATPVFEWVHLDGFGKEVQCEIRLARMPAARRNLVVGNLLDITARKQTEEELLKALAREKELSELKSNFVSIVSHEFRTPMEIIMTSGEILQRYFDRLKPEERQTHLQGIHESVRRMAHLMDEVLVLSTVEAGKMQFTPAPLDLNVFCRRLVDEILFATNRRNPIEFTAAVPEAVSADENLLRHILTNLLSNAVKYSPPGAALQFAVHHENETAVFRVTDRGCGIPAADHDRLFQAFHRARNVRHTSGTGLGLVIVKRCVQLHGGAIHFESVEGQGTTFTVSLPLFREPAHASEPAPS